MKKQSLLIVLVSFILVACDQTGQSDADLRVGTIAGPETALMEAARDVAISDHDVKIDIVVFEDYVLPNTALSDGSIDANAMQTVHYFEKVLENTGYALIPVGYTFIYPMGIYSSRYDSITELPEGARVAIPNDASNEPRSLLILEQAGLVSLSDEPAGLDWSVRDIQDNPLQLQIVELDAAQLPRVLGDVDAAIINTNYALPAGLLPSEDAIFIEEVNPLYANIIAVRQGEETDEAVAALVASYQSPEVSALADTLFQGQAIPAWEYLN